MLAITPFMADHAPSEKSLRLPLAGDRLRKWDDLIARKNIAQQDAIHAMIDWVCAQDPLLQSIVLGQIDPDPDLLGLALQRILPTGRASPGRADKRRPSR
jgi:hypothetical protein